MLKAEAIVDGCTAGCKCGTCPPRSIIVMDPMPPSKEHPWGTQELYLFGVDEYPSTIAEETGRKYKAITCETRESALKLNALVTFEWVHKLRKAGYRCHADPPVKIVIKPVPDEPKEGCNEEGCADGCKTHASCRR